MTAIMNIYRMSNNTLQVENVCRHCRFRLHRSLPFGKSTVSQMMPHCNIQMIKCKFCASVSQPCDRRPPHRWLRVKVEHLNIIQHLIIHATFILICFFSHAALLSLFAMWYSQYRKPAHILYDTTLFHPVPAKLPMVCSLAFATLTR